MKKYLVEGVGSFIFILTICCVVLGKSALAPVAIGSALMVMVYAGGHISGGHYNPAVTLAVWIRGKVNTADVPWYMLAQIIGGVLAGLISMFLTGAAGTPAAINVAPALAAEFIFTFALCYVVLNTATADDTAGNSYYGLAIGFTVLIGAVAVGGISGGMFNPAVAIGVSVAKASAWPNIWIYLLADFLGAAAAGLVFKFIAAGPEAK